MIRVRCVLRGLSYHMTIQPKGVRTPGICAKEKRKDSGKLVEEKKVHSAGEEVRNKEHR